MRQRSHPVAGRAAALALLGCLWLAQPALVQAQAQAQAQAGTAAREQGAATQQQTRKTEQANRAAAVEDETSTAAQAARTAQAEAAQFEAAQRSRNAAAAPSYGPVLTPRGQQAFDPARKDPAEVHDETDSLTRQAPAQQPEQSQQQSREVPRRPAAQPATAPLAPRPLRSADAVPAVPVPVPTPVPSPAPRPATPSSSIIGACQGSTCTDVGGQHYNGIGTGSTGVNSNGRLCVRTGITVQCF